jgi:hypothetical protein
MTNEIADWKADRCYSPIGNRQFRESAIANPRINNRHSSIRESSIANP